MSGDTSQATNSKFTRVPLGSKQDDMFLTIRQRGSDNIGVYQEGAIGLPSKYSPEETLRRLQEAMPVPEMHQPSYNDVLQNISFNNKERVTVLVGPPDIGKTTLGQVIAHATGINCHIIPCGNKVTSEFIKETTVNGHPLNDLFTEVENKVKEGTLSHISIRLLKNEIPEAIEDTEHGVKLDWSKVPDNKLVKAGQVVQRIAKTDGITEGKQKGAGITTKDGELLTILLHAIEHKEPAIIVLDEFSRRRADGGAMQNLYEVLAGGRDECVVEGGEHKRHTITNKDLREAGVYVLITSNPRTPGEPEVKEMPDALASRLAPVPMGQVTAQGIQHAFERGLMQLPVSTLYLSDQKRWEKDPAAFGDHLTKLMEYGMSDENKTRIPEDRRSFVANWSNVMRGAQQLAEFFDIWRQLEEQESSRIIYPNGMVERKPADVIQEISRRSDRGGDAASETRVGIRLLLNKLLEKSRRHVPEPMDAEGARIAPKFVPDEFPEERFGTRLVNELNLMVQQRYPDFHSKVRKFLERKMAMLKLLPAEQNEAIKKDMDAENAQLQAAANAGDQAAKQELENRLSGGGRTPLADLLNTPRQMQHSAEVGLWQDIWVDYLKQKYPDSIPAEAQARHILPDTAVARALHRLPQELQQQLEEIGRSATSIPLIDVTLPENKNDGIRAGQAGLIDWSQYDGEGKGLPPDAHQAIQQREQEKLDNSQSVIPDWQRFIMTLAQPVGAAALLAPRQKYNGGSMLFQHGFSARDKNNAYSEEVKLAEDRSETGMAISTTYIGHTGDDQPHFVHIVKQGNQLLIVGSEKIHDNLRRLLERQNITYVDRHQQDAREVIREKTSHMIEAGKAHLMHLKNEFDAIAATNDAGRKEEFITRCLSRNFDPDYRLEALKNLIADGGLSEIKAQVQPTTNLLQLVKSSIPKHGDHRLLNAFLNQNAPLMELVDLAAEKSDDALLKFITSLDDPAKGNLAEVKAVIDEEAKKAKERAQARVERFFSQPPATIQAIDYNKMMHRAFRHRMGPTDAWRDEVAQTSPAAAEPLLEEEAFFSNVSLTDMLMDDGKRLEPRQPVLLYDLDIKNIVAAARAASGRTAQAGR